jgi:hypothetical protein
MEFSRNVCTYVILIDSCSFDDIGLPPAYSNGSKRMALMHLNFRMLQNFSKSPHDQSRAVVGG